MKVLVTDAEHSSLDIEAEVPAGAGYELAVASCRPPEEVIEAAAGVDRRTPSSRVAETA